MKHSAARIIAAIPRACVAASACFVAGSCASAPVASERFLGRSFSIDFRMPVEGGVPVRVVDAKSGAPVAGAVVFAVDELDFSRDYSSPDLADEVVSNALLESGTAYLTDASGATRVAAAGAPQSLFAMHRDDFGRATLEVRDHTEQTIAVAPRALDVEVVDGKGRPQAGVPVVLGSCANSVGNPGACRAVTDDHGRASFSAIDLELSVHRTCGRSALVMLGFPCDLHAFRAIDAPVLEPVRFTLPDCGELQVDLVDDAGAPLSRAAAADLHACLAIRSEARRDGGADSPASDENTRQTAYVRVDEVPLRVPRVALGRDLGLTLWVRTSDDAGGGTTNHFTAFSSGDDSSELRGPEHAGAVVRARLSVPLLDVEEARSSEPHPPPVPQRTSTAVEPVDESSPSSVAVRVLLDTPIEPCELRARWRDDDAAGTPIGPASPLANVSWFDVTGRATIRDVTPGTWTFAITLVDRGQDEVVLAEIPHVAVAPGVHLRDPRLLSIDLRGNPRLSDHWMQAPVDPTRTGDAR